MKKIKTMAEYNKARARQKTISQEIKRLDTAYAKKVTRLSKEYAALRVQKVDYVESVREKERRHDDKT